MDDLISRAAALDALGECPYNWDDWPEEIQAVDDWKYYKDAIENIPAVDAIPVEWLREKMNMADDAGDLDSVDLISWLIQTWQKEQEAQDE